MRYRCGFLKLGLPFWGPCYKRIPLFGLYSGRVPYFRKQPGSRQRKSLSALGEAVACGLNEQGQCSIPPRTLNRGHSFFFWGGGGDREFQVRVIHFREVYRLPMNHREVGGLGTT